MRTRDRRGFAFEVPVKMTIAGPFEDIDGEEAEEAEEGNEKQKPWKPRTGTVIISSGRSEARSKPTGGRDGHYIATGYATTFNKYYKLFEEPDFIYYEQVDRHAFDKADMRDVVMLYNHTGRVVARTTNGTLTIKPDDTGLRVQADLSCTDVSRLTYDEIDSGLTPQMSMGFVVRKDQKTTKEDANGRIVVYRTILEIARLFDVSSVSFPANPGTVIIADEERGLQLHMLRAELARENERHKLRLMATI